MGRQLERQGKIFPHQVQAFIRAGDAQRAGGDIGAVLGAFTPAWRAAPVSAPAPTREERQESFRSMVRLTNLEQPDESTCQSAVIAMLCGDNESQIYPIRRRLQAMGAAGDPNVMARLLRERLGERYRLVTTANLAEVVGWLQQGYAIGTHGWHTGAGHVVLLDGVDIEPTGLCPRFSVKDPWGEFVGESWSFRAGVRFYDGEISSLLAYCLFVLNHGVRHSRHAYRSGDFSLSERGMICHLVEPESSVQPARRHKTNAAGLQIIRDSEGSKLTSYLCPSGIWTIGRGSTIGLNGQPVRPGQTITAEQQEILFARDISRFERDVNELVTVPLTANQFSALVSFAHNCGSDRDDDLIAEGLGDSTLLKKLNARDYPGAQAEFGRWTKGAGGAVLPGLVVRRQKEADLFGRG